MKKSFLKFLILFITYGTIYTIIEAIYKYPKPTHWSMFIVGGLMGYSVGLLNDMMSWDMSLFQQCLDGGIMITIVEGISGLILNVWLGLDVWHYTHYTFFFGQCCIGFTFLWCLLSGIIIILDDWLRYLWFDEEKPHYYIY